MERDLRAEFERRLLALVRDHLDRNDERYPDGWEIADFVITCRFYIAPDPEGDRQPWEGGFYGGWIPNQFTLGSSDSYWHDLELLEEAVRFVKRRFNDVLASANEQEDGGAEDGSDDERDS
jgi:hypothetical protein